MSQVSLYREAWLEFKLHFRDLLRWISGFGLLLSFFSYFALRESWHIFNLLWPVIHDAIVNDANPDWKMLSPAFDGADMVDVASSLSNTLLGMCPYFLTVAYLKLKPVYPDRKPSLDLADFFIWIWTLIKVGFASIGLSFVLGSGLAVVPGVLIFAGIHHIPPGHTSAALVISLVGSVILTCGIITALCYPMVKFLLVTPLFLSGEDAPLKKSWHVTKGHEWQLFWNYFGLGWTLFVIGFVALSIILAFFYAIDSLSPDSVCFMAALSLLVSFMSICAYALTNIFACMACRRLVREPEILSTNNTLLGT